MQHPPPNESLTTVKRLAVAAPFNLEATVRVLQRRPTNLIDFWEHQRYRRIVRIGGQLVLIEVTNRGTIDSPDLRMSILPRDISSRERTEAAQITGEILGLRRDPSPCQRRAEATPALRSTVLALRGMRPPRYPDFFETFANIIPLQQLSLEAGMSITRQLVQRFGDVLLLDGSRYLAFPSAEVIADIRTASLKRCGLSAKKSLALRSIAKAIASGALSAQEIERLSSSEALKRLVQLPGIGPWSAALALLRGFGRLDVFPQADTGVESSLTTLMHLRSRRSLARMADRFGECRGYLYYYGLASRLLSAGLIDPAPPAPGPRSDSTARAG